MLFHKDRTTIIPVFFFHKGCREICSFCNQNSMVKSQYCGPEDLHTHIEHYLTTGKKDHKIEVGFYGGTFTNLSKPEMSEYLRPVQYFIKKGLVSGIRISTRPDALHSEDMVSFLGDFNVIAVCLGIESIFEDVLYKCGRFYNIEKIGEAISLLKKNEIKTILQIMLGLPGDTREKSLKTLKWASEMKIDGIRICPTIVLKSTLLAELWHQGEFIPWKESLFYDLLELAVLLFWQKGIPVLRLGLAIDETLRENYLAGLMHPSLGDYVEYRTVFRVIADICNGRKQGEGKIILHQDLKPHICGYKSENRKRLFQEKRISSIEFSPEGIGISHILDHIKLMELEI